MPVELAAEVQPIAGLPGGEDGTQRADQLTHPAHRSLEFRAIALLDLGTDLGAQSEGEPPAGQQLVVIGLVGQLDRIARERDCDIGHQIQAAHGRRQGQWREHVVRALEGEHPGCAGLAQREGTVNGIGGPEEGGQYFHETLTLIWTHGA